MPTARLLTLREPAHTLYGEVQVDQIWKCLGGRDWWVPVWWGYLGWGRAMWPVTGQCHLNGIMSTADPSVNRQTDRTENITFPQCRWRAVKTNVLSQVNRYYHPQSWGKVMFLHMFVHLWGEGGSAFPQCHTPQDISPSTAVPSKRAVRILLEYCLVFIVTKASQNGKIRH